MQKWDLALNNRILKGTIQDVEDQIELTSTQNLKHEKAERAYYVHIYTWVKE